MATTYAERRDELIAAAREIATKAQSEERELTREEADDINAKGAEVAELAEKIKAATTAAETLSLLSNAALSAKAKDGGEGKDKEEAGLKFGTLGDYAVHGLKDAFSAIKGRRRTQADLAEYKSETPAEQVDPTHTVGTTGAGWLQPQIDTNVVHQFNQRPTIASWLGAGLTESTSIQYFVEKAWEASEGNGFGFVAAEGDRKPGLEFPDYDKVTEDLARIAGWIKISDQMAEDTPFLVSEINNRLLHELAMFEERALLNGTEDLVGLLNREGVQVETATSAADNLEAIFRAMMAVENATGLSADGIVLNPVDYQKLRLAKDENGQYFAGGPFHGAYGQGDSFSIKPPIWGMSNVITTTAVAPGTAVLGAGKVASTVYRKGGIRIEAANVDRDDFTRNRFTVLAEERLALTVRQPSAFVKLTLA